MVRCLANYIALFILGAIMLAFACAMQSLVANMPQDGMIWVWNLGCTCMMLAGVLTMVSPIVLHIMEND